MQDKHKVTLYLPPDLHRRLKIKSAVDVESMSAMVEKAILFYLQHPEVIEEVEEQSSTIGQQGKSQGNPGQSHQVYQCPDCRAPLVQRDGELISLKNQAGVLVEDIQEQETQEQKTQEQETQEQETLVPC